MYVIGIIENQINIMHIPVFQDPKLSLRQKKRIWRRIRNYFLGAHDRWSVNQVHNNKWKRENWAAHIREMPDFVKD
jgi:hypothetical protein